MRRGRLRARAGRWRARWRAPLAAAAVALLPAASFPAAPVPPAAPAAAPAVPVANAAPGAPDGGLAIEAEPDYYLLGPGQGGRVKFAVVLTARAARDVSLTVDASDLRGTAKIGADNCPEDPDRPYVFHCEAGAVDGAETVLPMEVGTAKGAKPGDHGTLRYSAEAADGRSATATSRMWVGPGITGLRERTEKPLRGVAPGSTVTFTPAVLNHGSVTPRRVGLTVTTTGLRPFRQYENCRYADADPPERPEHTPATVPYRVHCVFEQRLTPGKAYALGEPFRFRVPDTLMTTAVGFSFWLPGDEDHLPLRGVGSPYGLPPGTGPPASLTPVAREGEFHEFGRDRMVVSTTVGTDLRAVSEPVEGRVGDVVEIELGARNAGPGDIAMTGVGGAGADAGLSYEIVPPRGTTLDPDWDPDAEEGGWICADHRPGLRRYVCRLGGTFLAGEEETGSFFFRIGKRVPGAQGRVRVLGGDSEDYPARDPDPANDSAAIPVTVTGTGGTAVPEGYAGVNGTKSPDTGSPPSPSSPPSRDAGGLPGTLSLAAVGLGALVLLVAVRTRHAAIRAIMRFRSHGS